MRRDNNTSTDQINYFTLNILTRQQSSVKSTPSCVTGERESGDVGGDWFIKEKIRENKGMINNQSLEWSPVNKVYKFHHECGFYL